jgi:transcription initiation factor IIE alpha subunit
VSNAAQIIVGKKTKIDEHMVSIKSYLYDEGPQTADQLADFLGLARSRVVDILMLMREQGDVDTLQKGVRASESSGEGERAATYWLLYEDAVET